MYRPIRARRLAGLLVTAARDLLILFLCLWLAGCGEVRKLGSPGPQPGLLQYQQAALVPVPGGRRGAFVNPMGGNLFVLRRDATIPTSLGVHEEITFAYNSATREWRSNHQTTYDGARFVDPGGAVHEGLDQLADGAPIPGTEWAKLDATTLRADGGLHYVFDANAQLIEKHGAHQACPKIRYQRSATALRVMQIGCSPRQGELNEVLLYDLSLEGARIVTLSDRAGHVTSYDYDALGRLTTVRSAADAASGRPGARYEYDAVSGLLAALTSSDGNRVEYDYYSPTPFGEERLQLVTQIGEGDPQYRFSYYGETGPGIYLTLLTNPLGEDTRFFFDEQRRLSEVAFAAVQESERFRHDPASGSHLRPASHLTAGGRETAFTYDRDDIATRTDPSGNIVRMSYEREANNRGAPFHTALARIEDELGLVASRAYRLPYFQLGEIVNGEGEAVVLEWGNGTDYTQLESIRFPGGATRRFDAYDPLGQATRVTQGSGGGLQEARAFDLMGNLTQGSTGSAPEWGGIRSRRYDPDRNPVAIAVAGQDEFGRLSSQSEITISYRGDGQVLCVDRAPAGLGQGADHCFTYDSLGRPVSRSEFVDGQWRPEAYEYDRLGRQVATERANGMRIEREFDQRGRLVTKRALRNGELEGELQRSFVNGELAASFDSIVGGSEQYIRDSAGRIETIVYPGGETLSYEYDLRSRIRTETYRQVDSSLVKEVSYEYDLADRRVRTFDDGELVLEHTLVDSRLEKIHTGNDLERSFSYDPEHGFLTGSLTRDLGSAGETLEATTFTHELNDEAIAWKVSSATIATGVVAGMAEVWETRESYEIGPGSDPAVPGSQLGKRLIASDDGVEFRRYAWDEFSNRVDQGPESFHFNAEGNRLLAATTLAADGLERSLDYQYDAAGFVVERNGEPLSWNALGRITAHGDSRFEWDMQGRLHAAADALGARRWSQWGGRIESDALGRLLALDLGEIVLGLGEEAQRLYRHFDYRGNVQFVSNDGGEIVTLLEYLPFGVGFVHGLDSAVNFIRRLEVGAGLMIAGGRVLDTWVGRFLSPDPVFSLTNQFSYTFGNPIWFSDRSGRHPEVSGGGSTPGGQSLGLAIAIVGFGLTLAGAVILVVPISPPAALALAGLSVAVAAVGLVLAIDNVRSASPDLPGADAGGGASSNCDCSQQLRLGPAESDGSAGELELQTKPAGADAAGPRASGGAGTGSGALGTGGIGGLGAAVSPACGLIGFEILPLAWLAVRRRRRRSAR